MGAPPFHETEVETGWFAEELAGELTEPGFRCWVARDDDGRVAGFAYGIPTPEIPPDGWYGLLRDAVGQGPDGAARWLEGQFAVVWIAVHPDRRGRGIGRALLERLLAGAGADRAWLVSHDLDTPARALYRSLGFQELGRGPLGWHDAERVVLGADLPRTASPGSPGAARCRPVLAVWESGAMDEEVIPILRVADAAAAVDWYGRLGFAQEWVHRFEPGMPAFVSVARGRVRLFLSEHRGDARPDTLVYLRLDAVETIADEFGATVEEAPRGVREIELRDPDGNRLRIGTPTG